ncbi:HNH endonuclease family protein [Actinokineospora pegani]|uniref:HNH endonuclease family protein n=1 Tax=Actinokineospora pegani TaxID=2654637 RepID=UPI0012EA58EC|nr:HNH endonuclease family protein [Actinokineospora pegani]
MFSSGKLRTAGLTLLLTAGTLVGTAGAASAEPPGIPGPAAATAALAGLTVAAEGSMDGYDREEFPHWSTVSGTCNTREEVLKRDGDGVETGADCAATSGSWYSPYDGDTWTATGDVDIDHMVPLAAAWRSGAADWTETRREAFANDLSGPQLWAVTDNVNQSKSDQTPDEWKPPLESSWCTYASAYVQVKADYALTVDEAEKTALSDMLATC